LRGQDATRSVSGLFQGQPVVLSRTRAYDGAYLEQRTRLGPLRRERPRTRWAIAAAWLGHMTDDLRLLDCLPDAVVLVRQDGIIEFANSRVEQLLGYVPLELVGVPLERLIPDRFRQQHTQHFAAYCADPSFKSMEARPELYALTKDGRELPVEIGLGFVRSAQGILVVGNIRSISHRKMEELRLREALAEIENLRRRTLLENRYLVRELEDCLGVGEIVGQSEAIQKTRHEIEQVGPTDLNVLILGETGTGKELVARSIHQSSHRRNRPLVKVNCAALHHELIESELFGHEQGAFTGASAQRIGRFELANGSTIFLDEVTEIPRRLQSKLLRVLQEREFERLGSTTTIRVDVRVIAATNRDIQRMIRDAAFRQDLYFRLAVFAIDVPPLNQRRVDIPLLAWHIIRMKQGKLGRAIQEIPTDVMEALTQYDWPGNVRELENVIERGLVTSQGPVLSLGGPLETRSREIMTRGKNAEASRSGSLHDVERYHILDVLTKCQWRIKGTGNAAELLGLHPSTLRFRMQKLNITRPDMDADR
jgi:PAS domain S-box-containing protein